MPIHTYYLARSQPKPQTKKVEEEKKEKVCPLAGPEDEPTCVENDCAWWIEEEKTCAITVIAKSLLKINKNEK